MEEVKERNGSPGQLSGHVWKAAAHCERAVTSWKRAERREHLLTPDVDVVCRHGRGGPSHPAGTPVLPRAAFGLGGAA